MVLSTALSLRTVASLLFLLPLLLASSSFHDELVDSSSPEGVNSIDNTTTVWHWSSNLINNLLEYIRPPLPEIEREMEARWADLENKMASEMKGMQNQMEELRQSIEEKKRIMEEEIDVKIRNIEREIELEKRHIKNLIEKNIFDQRVGLDKVSHSIRNGVGLIVGGMSTCTGGLSHTFIRRSGGMQCGQYSWMITNHFNMTERMWLKDVASVSVALLVMNHASQSFLETLLPPLTVSYAVGRTVRNIVNKIEDDTVLSLRTKRIVAIIAGGGTAILALQFVTTTTTTSSATTTIVPFIIPTIAASIAGSKLIFDSVADEVVGNWFRMIEKIGPQRLNIPHRIYNTLYKRFQKYCIYPAQEAFDEINNAVFHDTTTTLAASQKNGTTTKSLHDKVRDAVSRSMRIRLTWYVATGGVLFQLLLRRLHPHI